MTEAASSEERACESFAAPLTNQPLTSLPNPPGPTFPPSLALFRQPGYRVFLFITDSLSVSHQLIASMRAARAVTPDLWQPLLRPQCGELRGLSG